MNILIDIAHPAHVHLLRNAYFNMLADGHRVWVTVKDLPVAMRLMDIYGIPYITLGKKKDALWKKGVDQLLYDWKILRLVKKHKIGVGVGSSITIAHVSKLSKMKSIILDDDDDAVEPLFAKYAHPFCDAILSPDCVKRKARQTIGYSGYHELAYLHPKRFTPDSEVLREIGLSPEDTYFVMRFNAFKAHHDVGVQGLSLESKRKMIEMLEKRGRVFITTERNIDEEFKKYQLTVSPEKAHSLMAFATMFIGDSQTMSSEAAVLGVPSIRCNSFVGRLSVLEEEEHRYGLAFGFLPDETDKMFAKIEELLSSPNLKEEWAKKRKVLLADKIDVTAFLTWFIENYPESRRIMKENPDYQLRFK
jgi:Uncharacterized protein conserved in archaea